MRLKKAPWIALLSTANFEQVIIKIVILLGMHRHALIYKQNGTCKLYNCHMYTQITTTKKNYYFFFFSIYKKWNPQLQITILKQ